MSSGGMTGGGLRPAVGETIVAAGVLVLAAVMVWQTFEIPVSPLYAKVGPRVMPFIAAAGLGLLGVLLLIEALRGGWQPEEEKEVKPDNVALAWVAPVADVIFEDTFE